ncbi:MAG: peroxiredoxin [Deltaproteobacteria bacterium]|jgi:peroxiredoxin Q/BCP|nr:peroxiredoxin [Deltaproteobacteria bacterium]
MLEAGQRFPDFALEDARGGRCRLEDLAGRYAVVYFYPRINTPGCSLEARGFNSLLPEFARLGATVTGVSPDPPEALCKASDRNSYGLRLLSDPEHRLLEAAGVWQSKKLCGREFMGVARTTALLDPEGAVIRVWGKVKPKGHAEAVLKALEEARGSAGA